MGFVVDATPYVKWEGTNILAVRVSAEPDPLTPPGKPLEGMDFNYYGGIYRDVRLVLLDRIHVTHPLVANQTAGGGIFVTYPKADPQESRIHVKTQVENLSGSPAQVTVHQVLTDAEGRQVVQDQHPLRLTQGQALHVEQDLTVPRAHLWDPYSPYLYTLTTELQVAGKVVDRQTTPVGIHRIEHTNDGFYINGKYLYLRGTNRHQAYPYVGDAASNSIQEREARLIRQGGYVAVRAAHYTHDPAFLDACDKTGLLVIECIPGWQHWPDSPVFTERLYQAAREMFRRDRNHPSIMLWETMLNETRYPVEVAEKLQQIAHQELPGDQTWTVGDYWGHLETAHCFDVLYKQVKNFPPNGDVMVNIPEDMISIKPLYSREWGDGAGEKPRAGLIEDEMEQVRQCRSRLNCLEGDGYFDWCMLDANPHMAGHFSWCFHDFPRGLSPNTEYCGAVDFCRYPKFSYYMHQSMRDAHRDLPGLFQGPMVHIASYNQSAEFPSSANEIWVFSNCDSVRLYRNGTLIGTQTRQERAKMYPHIVSKGGSPAFQFPVSGFEAGTLHADAFLQGRVVASHSVSTPGKPHHFRLIFPDEGIAPVADGSDMIPIWIELVDEAGTRIPDSEARIHLAVTGEGRLIGEGNSYAGVEDQYLEGGVGCCYIRTSTQTGQVTLSVSASGVETSSLTLQTLESQTLEVPDGEHAPFLAPEPRPDHSIDERPVSQRLEPVKIAQVLTDCSSVYPVENMIDGDDHNWWVSGSGEMPQSVTIVLPWDENITSARIRFQKDSSTYHHRIETSSDGQKWDELLTRECTGWDLKPIKVGRNITYFRITFLSVSEGNPGISEISLYE